MVPHHHLLYIGNREGKVLVYDVLSSPPNLLAKLSHPTLKSNARQTALSFDGRSVPLAISLVSGMSDVRFPPESFSAASTMGACGVGMHRSAVNNSPISARQKAM